MAQIADAFVEINPDITGFAAELKAKLAAIHVTYNVKVKLDIDRSALNRVQRQARITGANIGNNIYKGLSPRAARIANSLTAAIVPRRLRNAIRSVIGSASSMASKVGSIVGKTFTSVGKGVSGAGETAAYWLEALGQMIGQFSAAGGAAVASLASSVAKGGGKIGETMAALGAGIAEAAGPIGAVVAVILAATVATVGLTGVMAALQAGFAALLIVIVPVVAAVYSLVGAIGALGAVAGGAILALPGVISTIGGAVGVLALAWDKFNNELQKSGTGPLHNLKLHIENAVFAAIGFDDIVTKLTTQTLPKLLPGISQVAVAWGHVFSEIVKLLQSKQIIDAITSSLADMAFFVNQLVPLIRPLATIFITLSQAAQPAITGIVASVQQLVGWLAQFFTQLAKSGELQQIFAVVGQSISMLVGIVPTLLQVFVGFFKVAGPGFIQLMGVLGSFLDQFNAWINSVQGQQVLSQFFGAVNSMIGDLLPLAQLLFVAFMQLAPVFADLMTAVRPIIDQLVPVITQMVQAMLPGLLAFLGQIQAVMADKTVQGALVQLATVFGQVFAEFAMFDPKTAAEFIFMLQGIVEAVGGMLIVLGPVVRYLTMFAATVISAAEAVGEFAGRLFGAKSEGTGFTAVVKQILTWIIDLIKKIPGVGWALNNLDDKLEATKRVMDTTAAAGQNIGYGVESGLVDAYNSGYWDKLGGKALTLAETFDKLFQAHNLQNADPNNINWRALATEVGQYTAGVKEATKVLGNRIKAPKMDPKFAAGYAAPIDKKKTPAGQIVDTVKEALGRLDSKKLTGKAYDSAREIATWIAKGVLSGARRVTKAVEAMLANKTIKRNLDALAANVVKRDAVIKEIKKQQDLLAKMISDKAKFRDALADTLMTGRDLANRWKDFAPDPREIRNALAESLRELRSFTTTIKSLIGKGVSQGLVDQLASAGVAGGGAVAKALAAASPAQIKEINTLFDTIGAESMANADKLAADLYDPGIATIQGYIKGLQSQQKALDTQIQKQLVGVVTQSKKILGIKSPSTVYQSMGADSMAGFILGLQQPYGKMTFDRWATKIFVDPMYEIGKELVDGLVLGVQNREWYLRKSLTDMSTLIVATIKQALGVHSPSTVFAEIGYDSVSGYVSGLAQGAGLLQSQLGMFGGVRPSYGSVGAVGGTANVPNVYVQTFIGDKELTEIVDHRVAVNDEQSARALTYGRRSGTGW